MSHPQNSRRITLKQISNQLSILDASYQNMIIQTADEAWEVSPTHPSTGDTVRATTLWKGVCEILGTKDLNCSFIDIQGPLNTAALLWNQSEFMIAMLTDPVGLFIFFQSLRDYNLSVDFKCL